MKKYISILAPIILMAAIFYFKADILKIYKSFPEISKSVPDIVSDIKKEISAPSPLRGPSERPQASKPTVLLTKAGVINWTNIQRSENGGLPALAENSKLNSAAEVKLKDMFAKQYFEHISPSGAGPGDLVENAGYQYIMSGENLALGNFNGNKDLVLAWMNSPGHRANILNSRYQEIGVAVGMGVFEGRETWLAVQEFGKPSSSCPAVDTNLKTSIKSYENKLTDLKKSADALKAELAVSQPQTRAEYNTYNEKVNAYNDLARQINTLVGELKGMVDSYNSEVRIFNLCAEN